MMAQVNQRVDVPVTIEDSLAINPENGKAFMHVDECWYCGPCAARCPTGAVSVNMPYLIR